LGGTRAETEAEYRRDGAAGDGLLDITAFLTARRKAGGKRITLRQRARILDKSF
jgi:hypothetical protein